MMWFIGLISAALVLETALASPILVSQLLADGQLSPRAIQNLTAVNYKGVNMGFAGHYSAPAQHRQDRLNHIYTWFQPASDLEAVDDMSSVPLLIWLQVRGRFFLITNPSSLFSPPFEHSRCPSKSLN